MRWIRWVPVAFAIVSMGVAAALFFGPHREDRQTSVAADEALAAAQQASVALLSYAPDTLDGDLTNARSQLTGEFLTYYSDFADQFVVPGVKEKDIRAQATVVRAAVISARPDTAHVLVFLNQTTTSRDNPTPSQSASSVDVGLTKVDGSWRISSFDPI